MHMQGTPETMQDDPQYDFAPVEIYRFLESRIAAAMAAGYPGRKSALIPVLVLASRYIIISS